MTDQKPKIDLKSRLGKKTVSSPSGHSIPPPTGIPRPSGIPAPPFGSAPATDSFVNSAPPPPRVEPQAIKVEMSEEVRQEQRKQGKKFRILAVAAAFAGGVLGFAIGSGHERSKVADQALNDASVLAKEIKEAMGVAENLADTAKSAKEKLAAGKLPEEEINKLGGLRVPFGGDKLGGRNIGRFKKDISSGLLALAGDAEKVNDQTETVQRIFGGARKALNEVFQQNATPKVHWAAVAEGGPHGPMLSMLAIPEPFLLKAEKGGWPDSIKFKIEGKDTTVKRYTKGDPSGNDPLYIPVDPTSQTAVCPQDVVMRFGRQLQDLENMLRGIKDPGGHEETGLIDAGRAIEDKLRSIGTPG